MVEVVVDHFHREVGFTADLTAGLLLFCLWLLCHLSIVLQVYAVNWTLTYGCSLIDNLVVANIAIELFHENDVVGFFFWDSVADLMKTGIATITVENLVNLLVAFSGKAYFAVSFKQRLEFLLRSWLLFLEWLFHVHFLDGHYLHRVVQKLLCFVAVAFFKQ